MRYIEEHRRSKLAELPVSGTIVALLWFGCFGPWVYHRSGALSLNAYDMAEWITFLPQVRSGSLTVGRFHFLGLLSLTTVLTAAWALGSPRRWWALALSVLGVVMLMPGYPFILWYRTDYGVQVQLGLATATIVVSILSGWLRKTTVMLGLTTLAALIGMVLSSWSLVAVRPAVTELYGAIPTIGWGWYAMNAGLMSLLVMSVVRVLR